MKVFYSASISRSKRLLPISQDLVRYIEKLGHQVLTTHLVDEKYSQETGWHKKYDAHQVYQDAKNRLKKADVLITECTTPSFGAAFWIDKAIAMNKPLLSLHYGLAYSNAPLMLQGCQEKINLQMYTEDNAKQVIKKFFDQLK